MLTSTCRCGGALEMRRKKSLSGADGLVWQCVDCSRIHGPVAARDLVDIEPALLTSFPWVHHVKKPQPNSKRRAYNAALHSSHWKRLREMVLSARPRCERQGPGCTAVATELNHRHYDTLGQEKPEDVEASCWTCNQNERQQRVTGAVLGSA